MNVMFQSPMLPDWLSLPHCEGVELDFPLVLRGVPIGMHRAAVTVADYGGTLEPVYFAIQSLDDPEKWVPLRGGDKLHPCLDDDLRDAIHAAFAEDSYAKSEASEKIAEFVRDSREDRRRFG